MNNQKNIVLCGVGGQGTVLASKLLAAAAMSKDIPVMSAETIGWETPPTLPKPLVWLSVVVVYSVIFVWVIISIRQ